MSKTKPIVIVLSDPNFDQACTQAYKLALGLWQIDSDGHSPHRKTRDFILEVKFKNYTHSGSMGGQEHCYTFQSSLK